ncbi:signal peptidase I [Paraprevotella xylaniphila YIT 11841]|jgi:signal peptidase I|uniref:Signal peptidase I n=1 Tax=Paraprevotella xylaniphila YIT 11841 TaxID=762982 RepID=F3QVP0_9BACT|nr:S26 family signal peptidase [Paraprevotella xylaniphila]EGG52821.1 signal peptidase I [Paraprevotella xylaniphila YIT 11841]
MKKLRQKPTRAQWIKMGVVMALYLAFLVWIKSWWGLLVVPFIYDAYITKRIPWTWWKEAESPVTRTVMSWVDAIVFALVAVYFVNIYFFQNYTIPSSSLEKSLLVGDYLFVSKMSYGPRKPQTPLSMPLTQHTMPLVGCKSYIEWPQWDYERVPGGRVQLNDIVVFNYPAGDTVTVNPEYQNMDFYAIAYGIGGQQYMQLHGGYPLLDSLTRQQQRDFFAELYAMGRQYIDQNSQMFGGVMSRPVDRRENYVKRCVGLPGQTLQIKNHVVYLDGKPNKEPDNVQYDYFVRLKQDIPDELVRELGISQEDLASLSETGTMPLTQRAYERLKTCTDIVDSIAYDSTNSVPDGLYPLNAWTGWTRDNYGPVWIPAKGESVKLTMDNIAVYERPIRVYEHNDLEVKDGKIFINGKQADSYTFKMDYYWMQGDNRHNSADSRYWGFVPEDHIVGKPILIWLSLDKDRGWFDGHVRWNRLFRWVDNIK